MASYKWSKEAVKWLINKIKSTFLPKSDFLEAKMGWGGANIAGDISPIDVAMSSLHSANRAELCNPAGVTIEYSTDAGATWVDYGASDAQKKALFSSAYKSHFYLGKATGPKNTNKNVKLRVTMNATKMWIYTNLKKILINFSTEGADCTVSFEKSKKGSEDTWVDAGTYPIAGWTGWNSYSVIVGPFGGRDDQTSNTARIRMTFAITSLNSNYSCLSYLLNICVFGTTAWEAPSNIARIGHLYSWDTDGNAKFPGSITATKINGHTIQSDVPANAKFTDTTYPAATASADGLMAKADKAKLDGFGVATEYAKKAEVAVKPIVYQNITVPASAWGSGAGFAGATRTRYADIALEGVTSDLYATVTFNPDDIDNYNLAGICETKDGKITIYAEYAPSVAITIPTIVVGEADNNLEKPTIIMSATPHNYLDNSNFANPVNQRGKTTYTGSGYTIDRWRIWRDDDSVSVVNGGVTVSGSSLFMYLEPGTINKNGVYTLAAKTADGTIDVTTGTPQAGAWGTMCTLSYDANVNKVWVALNAGHTYVWAALYEGEYTKDTLPPYQPKGYAVELAECLRYFERVNVHDFSDGGQNLYKNIRFANKRVIPTVTWVMTQSDNLNGNDTSNWNITVNDANGVHASMTDKTARAYWYGYADVSADL